MSYIFSNLLKEFKDMGEPGAAKLEKFEKNIETIKNYFNKLENFNTQTDLLKFKGENNNEFTAETDYIQWLKTLKNGSDNPNRKIHIFYYNLISDLESYTKLYLNYNSLKDRYNGTTTSNTLDTPSVSIDSITTTNDPSLATITINNDDISKFKEGENVNLSNTVPAELNQDF